MKTQCDFAIFGLIDKWKLLGNISAYQFATDNGIEMPVFWNYYRERKIMKRNDAKIH